MDWKWGGWYENRLFSHFWPNLGPHFDPKNVEVLKQNFNFQFLRETEAILLPSMWLKDWLTKGNTSKIVTFCWFWPKKGQNFVHISLFLLVLLANLVFSFHSDISITTQLTLAYKSFIKHLLNVIRYTSCKIWKNPIEVPVSLFFSQQWT